MFLPESVKLLISDKIATVRLLFIAVPVGAIIGEVVGALVRILDGTSEVFGEAAVAIGAIIGDAPTEPLLVQLPLPQ